MVRVKVATKKLETANARQITYSKRKLGIAKKAKELAILCDTDVALLTFSPNGKPTLCVGQDRDLSSVVERLSNLTIQERSKREMDTLELLRRIFKKEGHEIDPEKLLPDGKHRLEELQNQLLKLQEKIVEKNNKLSTLLKPEIVNDPARLKEMEKSLVESLKKLGERKDHLLERRVRKPWSTSQATRNPWVPEATLIQNGRLGHIKLELDPSNAYSLYSRGSGSGSGSN